MYARTWRNPKTGGSETQLLLLGGWKKLGQVGFSSNTPCCKEVEIKCSPQKKRHKLKQELKQIKELACLPTYRWFIGGSSWGNKDHPSYWRKSTLLREFFGTSSPTFLRHTFGWSSGENKKGQQKPGLVTNPKVSKSPSDDQVEPKNETSFMTNNLKRRAVKSMICI